MCASPGHVHTCSPDVLMSHSGHIPTVHSNIWPLHNKEETLTEASLMLPSPADSLAILLIIGETFVGPYSWILGRQFWYASTTPWISGEHEMQHNYAGLKRESINEADEASQ